MWAKWVCQPDAKEAKKDKPKAMTRRVSGRELQDLMQYVLAERCAGVDVAQVLVALFQDGMPVAYPETKVFTADNAVEDVLYALFALGMQQDTLTGLCDTISALGIDAPDNIIAVFNGLYAV